MLCKAMAAVDFPAPPEPMIITFFINIPQIDLVSDYDMISIITIHYLIIILIFFMKETSLLVQKYNPDWKNMFQEIREIIEDKLKDLLITIEHVGSTAVPGLAAKPIIDIDIIYKNETPLSEIVSSLNELGYQHNGDQGIPGRTMEVRIPENSTHPILDTIKHHLYVCSEDNDELNRHIVFRDFLLANDWFV